MLRSVGRDLLRVSWVEATVSAAVVVVRVIWSTPSCSRVRDVSVTETLRAAVSKRIVGSELLIESLRSVAVVAVVAGHATAERSWRV